MSSPESSYNDDPEEQTAKASDLLKHLGETQDTYFQDLQPALVCNSSVTAGMICGQQLQQMR